MRISGDFLVVVDTPRGSAIRFMFDEERRVFTVARFLRDLGRAAVDGIERFFMASNRGGGRRFQALGHFGIARARATLRRSLLDPGGGRRRAGLG